MAGYFQTCNCCGHAYGNAPGARAYIRHVKGTHDDGTPVTPEVTWGFTAMAREYLKDPTTFEEWAAGYDPKCVETLGWVQALSFAGVPKSPEYQAWREEHGLV